MQVLGTIMKTTRGTLKAVSTPLFKSAHGTGQKPPTQEDLISSTRWLCRMPFLPPPCTPISPRNIPSAWKTPLSLSKAADGRKCSANGDEGWVPTHYYTLYYRPAKPCLQHEAAAHHTPGSSAPGPQGLARYSTRKATKQLRRTTKERHTHRGRRREESWQAALRRQCVSVSLNNTNQAPQILIFTVINFIQRRSRLTGFVWESSGNLMCL